LGDYQRLEDINEDSRLPETIIGAHPLIMTWDRILAAGYRHKLLLMISTWNADKKQRSDQERTIAVLKAKKIPFEVLDAADPNVKDRYVNPYSGLIILFEPELQCYSCILSFF